MEQSIRSKHRLAWLIALLMTAALYGLIALKMDVRFAMNDDAIIMRALMGYGTGTPAVFHLYTHGVVVWAIGLLHRIAPLVPWFSWVQLALLFLALTVIAKSLMQCFVNNDKPMLPGAVLAAAFFIGFGLEYVAQFTYTCTSAMLGAAAAAQMLSIDFHRARFRQIVSRMLGAAVLLALCYAVRPKAALPAVAYCGLSFAFLSWEHFGKGSKRSLRPMAVSLLLIGVVLGGMTGVRKLEEVNFVSPEYLKWDQERIELLDFRATKGISEEMLEQAGWDETTLELVNRWFFLEKSITTDALRTINDALEQQDQRTVIERLKEAKQLITTRLKKSAYSFRLMGMAVIAGAAAALGAFCSPGKRFRLLWVLGCVAGGLMLMILYLALQGRLPLRAVMAPALPAIVMVFALLPACLPQMRFTRVCTYALAAVVLVYTLCNMGSLWNLLLRRDGAQQPGKAFADLEAYAVANRDDFFIADGAFAAQDVRAFPAYPDGLPMNISYWGGWDMRSPANEALFERFGLDVWHFDPEAFLRQDVFFATDQIETPPELLLNWLEKRTGREIRWEVYAQHGDAYILSFY